jgi:hypothetical protein
VIRNEHKILVGKPEEDKLNGKSESAREDNITITLEENGLDLRGPD